jgi:hypothetical protein
MVGTVKFEARTQRATQIVLDVERLGILEIRASSAGPARTSATIALRVSLSSKATTSGGRLNSMHLRDYCGSAREAALNMFDWRSLLEKSE